MNLSSFGARSARDPFSESRCAITDRPESASDEFVLERTYRARLSDVWKLWTTPAEIERWWAPEGFDTSVQELDLRPGGEMRYTMTAVASPQIAFMRSEGLPLVTSTAIRYVEIEPERRIAYDVIVDFAPGVETYTTRHDAEFTQRDGGRVRVTLRIGAMHDRDWSERALAGCTSQLERLGVVVHAREPGSSIALRPVEVRDLDAIFEQMRDPQAVHMAAFTAPDPDDRAAFDAHMATIRSSPQNHLRAIDVDGVFVGTIAAYVADGLTEVTYWIDRAAWGRGIASQALARLVAQIRVRPLRARAASDNLASIRVLRKAGFEPIGTDVGFAAARSSEIEETIFELR